MNRLASICIATLIAFPSLGYSQETRRSQAPVRPTTTIIPARSEGVPRPAKPVGRPTSSRVIQTQAMDEGVVMEPGSEMMMGESYSSPSEVFYEDEGVGCESCGDSGCSSCGVGSSFGMDLCNPRGFDGRQLCICLPAHGWVSVDYLGWHQRGMDLPPLVTTSPAGTAQAAAGVLPGATILYGGNNNVLDQNMSGTRLRFGLWSANYPNRGVEGELFGFGTQNAIFDQTSSGSPILARPFYNNVTGVQDAELVAFPNVLSGRVRVDINSQLGSAAVRFRRIMCCSSSCGMSAFACQPVPTQSRVDFTLGWRYIQLRESLNITEDLSSLDTNNPGSFLINDSFQTFNQFNGAELGAEWMGRRGYWSLDMLMRLGLGNTRQQLTIDGTTSSPRNAAPTTGGLLAQPGRNIGTYERNQFGIVPELGATIGYQLTQRLKLNLGYSFVYWSNVLRPGDQIDTTVNPNLLPPAIPGNSFLGPRFAFRETDYWVQGLSVGGEFRW